MKQPRSRTGGAAMFVAAGILLSRLAGLVRTRAIAHYLGLSNQADAFAAGFKIPNFLQNLFGEGALSASFIPVYSSLLARGDREQADRVAGAVVTILALVVSVLVLIGIVAAPLFTPLIAPGFTGEKRELTIRVVQIIFPGTGFLVMSAWCLGVLNSHRRFMLSYTTGVFWNAAMIGTLIAFGRSPLPRLTVMLACGSVVGSMLQFLVQLPVVIKVAPDLKLSLAATSEHVRTVLRNFVPAFVSRGVVQVSAYVDGLIATLLPGGAAAALTNAQLIYTLPISLFGMSISAAELPAMSAAAGADANGMEVMRQRLNASLRQIAFFVVPSTVAFIALGDVVAATLLETGRFVHSDAIYVWCILLGSGIGLLASTLGRLYSFSYYALRDTRTPLRYAVVRVALTTVLGYLMALPLPRALGIDQSWGATGLTASAGIAGWVEMWLLRRTLNSRIGETGVPLPYVVKLWGASAGAAAVAWGVKLALPPMHPVLQGMLVLGPYGLVFVGATLLMRIPEATAAASRIRRRL